MSAIAELLARVQGYTDPVADWFNSKGVVLERCECGAGSAERIPDLGIDWRCVGCKKPVPGPFE